MLHSRDIRKCQNGFEVLFDLEKKNLFYDKINAVLSNNEYTIVSCSILKDEYIRRYGKLSDVYAISLSFIIERTIFLLDKMQKQLGEIQEEIKGMVFEASAGGGAVKVKVDGEQTVLEIKISKDIVDADDIEMLEDLVMVAVNDALNKSKEEYKNKMSGITGGFNIPGLF